MFISWAKKWYHTIFPPSFFKKVYDLGFTPNILTGISAGFKIATVLLFLFGYPLWAVLGIVLDYLFDFLDGGVARATNTASVRGALLDFVSDRVFRQLWIVAVAYAGFIDYKLAMWVILIDAFSFFMNDFVEMRKLKQIDWLLANHHFIFWGALFGNMPFFLTIGLFVNGALTVTNIVAAFVLNKDSKLT